MQSRRLYVILAASVLLIVATAASAQTAATCSSFTYFTTPSPYNASFESNGINDFGTTVGWASSTSVSNPAAQGFIRQPGGSMVLYQVPGAYYTWLNKRNYYGTSVGFFLTTPGSQPQGLVVTKYLGHATLKYPGAYSTVVTGINKWNTIVGWYTTQAGGAQHGFKYVNGTFTKIDYPGALATVPKAINDYNVIVGQYVTASYENPPHGFTWWNGQYRTEDVGTSGTQPQDINNAGTIVVSPNLIWYKNGSQKTVTVPGAFETMLYGINNVGQVTGMANYQLGTNNFAWKGFVARCQ